MRQVQASSSGPRTTEQPGRAIGGRFQDSHEDAPSADLGPSLPVQSLLLRVSAERLAGPVPSLCPNMPPGSASPGMWKWPGLLKRETYRRRGRGANKPALSRCPLSPPWPAFPPASLGATGLPITPESQVGRGQPSTEALGRHSLACREQRFSHWSALRGGQRGPGEPEATRWPPL